jgi:spore maturation protein CgeB
MNENLNFVNERLNTNTMDEIFVEEETIIDEEKFNIKPEDDKITNFFEGIIESKKLYKIKLFKIMLLKIKQQNNQTLLYFRTKIYLQ